jgi:hypothetical protein
MLRCKGSEGGPGPRDALRRDRTERRERAFLTGAVAEKYPSADKKCVKRIEYSEFTGGFAGVVGQV